MLKGKGKRALLLLTLCLNFIYPQRAIVYDVDYNADVVTVINYNKQIYQFKGTEDYEAGDVVALIMFTNGTRSVKDDSILKVQYDGYGEIDIPDYIRINGKRIYFNP